MKLIKPSRNNSDEDVYHTNENCPYVTPRYVTPDETTAPIDNYEECAWCADTIDHAGSREAPCPFCGEEINKLPDHLPCEQTP